MKKSLIILIVIIAIVLMAVGGAFGWYTAQIGPVSKENAQEKVVEIPSGTSTEKILQILKEQDLIREVFSAKIYIKLNKVKNLQAGKYTLSSGMSLEEILNHISSGDVVNEQIKITFKEGKNMRWIAKEIANNTNNSEEDVFKLLEDEEYIDSLIEEYWFLTDTIKNKDIYYPLEGYLYPDTYYFKDKDVSVKGIFKVLLDKEDEVLSKYKEDMEKQGAKPHQVLTLASIVELEGKGEEARKGIACVFFNRLKKKMSIGSDVTTYYAIKVDMSERDLYAKEINTYNPYNTRGPDMAGKLPIGPIAMASETSIKAVLNPTESDYLYFVSDSNGKIYFSKTYEEHQSTIKRLQKEGLWFEY